MKTLVGALLALVLAAPVLSSPAVDASKLTLSSPAAIVEIDVGKLKGELSRLAWSGDGQQIYVQTIEPDGRGSYKLRHYLVGLDGKTPSAVDQEPSWAQAYWPWKAAQAAPGLPTFKIDLEQQDKRATSTSTPMGGDMARGDASPGTGGLSTDEAVGAAHRTQTVKTVTLRLKGEVVGEFVNTAAMPGVTFGWGPAGTGLIAFSQRDGGRLIVMDDQGRKQEVPSTKASLFPAWTNDGKRLAYLEKTGRKKFVLKIVEVTRPAS